MNDSYATSSNCLAVGIYTRSNIIEPTYNNFFFFLCLYLMLNHCRHLKQEQRSRSLSLIYPRTEDQQAFSSNYTSCRYLYRLVNRMLLLPLIQLTWPVTFSSLSKHQRALLRLLFIVKKFPSPANLVIIGTFYILPTFSTSTNMFLLLGKIKVITPELIWLHRFTIF